MQGPSGTPTCVGRDIHRLDIAIRRYLDLHLHRRSIQSVTGNNGRIIGYLCDHADEEVCQRDLETAFGVTRSTASKVLSLMESKALITRESVERDARLKRIRLTPAALALSEQMHGDQQAMEALLLRGFTPDEREALADYLRRMRENLTNEKGLIE